MDGKEAALDSASNIAIINNCLSVLVLYRSRTNWGTLYSHTHYLYLEYFANNHSTHQFVFDGGRKTGGPGEKPSKQGRERTNKLNSHEVPRPGIEPGTTTVRGKRAFPRQVQ